MRRQYITHPKFQISFTVSFVLGVLFIATALGLATAGTLYLIAGSAGLSSDQQIILRSGAQQIIIGSVVVALILALIFTFIGLYLSYKFVGPLSRLELWLEQYLAGDIHPYLKLRKGDELEKSATLLFNIIEKSKGRR
jgi:hypothetical protein